MSKATRMTRREFLTLTLGAGFLWLIRSRLPSSVAAWLDGRSLLTSRLISLFKHQDSARIVGLEYLQSYPGEADEYVLTDLISAGFTGGSELLSRADEHELRELLVREMRQDFEVEKVVKLQGWILSVTEARLCALAALV